MTQNEAQEQAEFQAAMTANGSPLTFGSDGVGGYHNHATQMAWLAWQAAKAAAKSMNEDWRDALLEVADSIERAEGSVAKRARLLAAQLFDITTPPRSPAAMKASMLATADAAIAVLTREPLRCDGCGKTIAEHGPLLRCRAG